MLFQTEFENLKSGTSENLEVDKSFRVYKQQKRKRQLATIYDIMMKPVHDVNLTKHPKNLLENKVTSKTEYTNTQQGLPDYVYIISL